MTNRRKTHDAWYVTARYSDAGAHGSTAWLLGPFETHKAAMCMVQPVSYACRHHMDDPRFQFASYGTAKLTIPTTKQHPPGRLPLDKCVDEVWISCVIFGGLKR